LPALFLIYFWNTLIKVKKKKLLKICLTRLEKEYKNGSITKDKINKRGYDKFLEISDNIEVIINYDKIKDDEKWDLK